MRTTFTASELQNATLWRVVSLTAGKTYRWSEAPLSIDSGFGSLQISGGLQNAEVDQTAKWLSQQPETRRATCDMNGINVASLLAEGHEFDGAPVEIALWREGDAWEDRLILLSGYVVSFGWGGAEEPLRLEVEQGPLQDRGLLPDPQWVVSVSTWPYAAENLNGKYYPVVLGCPGVGTVAAVPALFVESTVQGGTNNYLLVAGHLVSATTVVVFDGSNSETLTVISGVDGEGRPVALVDLGAATTLAVDPELNYYTSWTEAGWRTGGQDSGAGSVLQAVLSQSTLPVDWGAVGSARDILDGYTVGAFIQNPLSPLEWITSALLPLLPAVVVVGPSGWRVAPVPLVPTRADCVATVEAGDGRPGAVRLGAVQRIGRDEVVNDLALRYALDAIANSSSKTAIFSGLFIESATLPRLSFRLYGRRVWTEETVALYDDSTAYKVLRWRSSAYAFSRNAATYSLPGWESWISPGRLVWLSDSRLQVDVPCWVERSTLTADGRTELDLVWWRYA